MKLVAAVEGGGTTFSVAICQAKTGKILHRLSVDSSTGDPATTLTRCALFLQRETISGLGIACFGPIGLNPKDTTTFGRILSTSPKKSWRNVDILTPLLEACGGCPFLLDTDVNAPAALEFAMANHSSVDSSSSDAVSISSCAYVTVGTGVGVGLVVNGKTVQGFMHPEGGHVPVHPLPGDTFGGYSWGKDSSIPFNGLNTVEALASSVALMERYEQELRIVMGENATDAVRLDRQELKNVPDGSDIWDHAVNALATLATTMILLLSIEKIVFGGGIMQRPLLLEKIRTRTKELLNNYVALDNDALDKMIVVSTHGKDAGLQGAIHLAQRALEGVKPDMALVKMKHEAFHSGLWFGTAIGVVGTALFTRFFFHTATTTRRR